MTARILPRPENVEVPEAERLDAVERGEDAKQLLPGRFRDRVRRQRTAFHRFDLGEDRRVAVGGRAGGEDEPLHARTASRVEEHGRPLHVGQHAATGILDRTRDRRDRPLVEDDVDPFHAARDRLLVDERPLHELEVPLERRDVRPPPAREVIEDAYPLAVLEKTLRQRRTNEPSPARHEISRHAPRL